MSYRESCLIPLDHPSLAGHFPGHPVVPGVVVLDLVRQALERWQPGAVIKGFPMAKFQALLAPGQGFEIQLDEPSPGTIRFECYTAEHLLVQGRLEYRYRESA